MSDGYRDEYNKRHQIAHEGAHSLGMKCPICREYKNGHIDFEDMTLKEKVENLNKRLLEIEKLINTGYLNPFNIL